jgi:hypothetical protein
MASSDDGLTLVRFARHRAHPRLGLWYTIVRDASPEHRRRDADEGEDTIAIAQTVR